MLRPDKARFAQAFARVADTYCEGVTVDEDGDDVDVSGFDVSAFAPAGVRMGVRLRMIERADGFQGGIDDSGVGDRIIESLRREGFVVMREEDVDG